MPDPRAHPQAALARRVAVRTLLLGIGIMGLKLGVFYLTNSAAVLTDALESIINLVAAGLMIYSVWLANQPADFHHPYGHGKIEFVTIGIEGTLILGAGVLIAYEGFSRLLFENRIRTEALGTGALYLAGVAVLATGLAAYVWRAGIKYQSPVLVADGKHLMTDVVSTLGGLGGLLLVRHTGQTWWDPAIALLLAAAILYTSSKLLFQSGRGLMDYTDKEDDAAIRGILDAEVQGGAIRGYHKVRHRHTGPFTWVDMHLQLDPEMSVQRAHDVATRIEKRIEERLGAEASDATAHLEPSDGRPSEARTAPPETPGRPLPPSATAGGTGTESARRPPQDAGEAGPAGA